MSYDISLKDPKTKETIILDFSHNIRGGTYAIGGTQEAWLNVTYNYSSHFYRLLGEEGIRSLYGKTGKESIPILQEAIGKLKDDVSDNYWDATEGNAREALKGLLTLARLAPHGIWSGD